MKNFRKLGKQEMKNITGGRAIVCPEGLCFNTVLEVCDWPSNGNCVEGGLTCTITAKDTPGCGTGATMTFPSGTTTADAEAWCKNQPCCGSIAC
ncbi:hypothetical protein D3C86_1708970 [compost metagenome]